MILIPGQTGHIQVFYTVIPWLGCAGFGLIFGRWVFRNAGQAYRKAFRLGILSLVLFAGVRIIGGFGNIHPPEILGWMDFLHVTKYPPSIAFLLLTLGIVMLCLFLFSRLKEAIKSWGKPLLVFGRSALFFYLIHLYVFGIVGLFFTPQGTGIPLMYVLWLGSLFLL